MSKKKSRSADPSERARSEGPCRIRADPPMASNSKEIALGMVGVATSRHAATIRRANNTSGKRTDIYPWPLNASYADTPLIQWDPGLLCLLAPDLTLPQRFY